MDADVRTGQRMEGCGEDESRVFGANGRDVANDNGERLLPFATNCKLALTNMFLSLRKGGISHTPNGTRPNDHKQIDYILTRQTHRPRVQDFEVVPQPPAPAKADSDHNILFIEDRRSGHFAPNKQIRRPIKRGEFDRHFSCPMERVVNE